MIYQWVTSGCQRELDFLWLTFIDHCLSIFVTGLLLLMISAIIQISKPMLETRSIGACAELKPVEQVKSEISSVELIAELVEVELQKVICRFSIGSWQCF